MVNLSAPVVGEVSRQTFICVYMHYGHTRIRRQGSINCSLLGVDNGVFQPQGDQGDQGVETDKEFV